jgi:transcriptional regulator with GAF, ATPase, and Fis domain/tetratricopeptide (TPR) repeat protein
MLAAPFAPLDRLLHEHRWADAEAELRRLEGTDASRDPGLLRGWRRLEEGRGTRAGLAGHVARFLARDASARTSPHVRVEKGIAHVWSGQLEEAREELLAALDALAGSSDLRTRATAENHVGLTYMTPLDPSRARRAFRVARELAAAGGHHDLVLPIELNLAHVELRAGDMYRAVTLYRKALATGLAHGLEAGTRSAHFNLGNCYYELGRPKLARRHLRAARAIAQRRGEPWHEAWAELILGEVDRKEGHVDRAELSLQRVEALFRSIGGYGPTERAWVEARRVEMHLTAGRYAEAAALAKRCGGPEVEETPRLYVALLEARARKALDPSPKRAAELERIARDAERIGVSELAWQARSAASRVRLEAYAEGVLDGAPSKDLDRVVGRAAQDWQRARALFAGLTSQLPEGHRAAFVRDPSRAEEARWLALTEAIVARLGSAGGAERPLRGEDHARWVRVMTRLGELAVADDVAGVLARALDLLLELVGAKVAHLWLDGDGALSPIACARDADGRDLQVKARPKRGDTLPPSEVGGAPARGREVHTLAPHPEVTGLLQLEDLRGSTLAEDERAELVTAFALSLAGFVRVARARQELRSQNATREAIASQLALDLARTEAALEVARAAAPVAARERGGLIGQSKAMRDVFAQLDRIQRTPLPVLVTGESGTGKELVARLVHDESGRRGESFVAVNCGALSESLLESELFGHVRGAFTGAMKDAPGLFVVADKGTLFLDEVGEMSLAMQAKLLRVLQEGEVRPVGGAKVRKVDARIVAATHRDLEELVREGRFREDLYYRLYILSIHMPPLRAREDDIVLIARALLDRVAPGKSLGPDAIAWLLGQRWPGNVRELKAVLEAAAVYSDGPVLHAESFAPRRAPEVPKREREEPSLEGVPEDLSRIEAWAIGRSLRRHQGNVAAAARALGIGRATLYRKMTEYGLTPPR